MKDAAMKGIEGLGRRITAVLIAQQALASAAFIAAASLNAIVAADLTGSPSLAGVPSAVYLLAGAFAAFGWGILNDTLGRRRALVFGLLVGSVGSAVAFFAIAARSLALFLAGML
jgi:MFS family permease